VWSELSGPHEEGQTTRDLSGDTVRLLTLAAGPWPLVPRPSGHSTRGARHGALVSWYMVAPTSSHSILGVQGAGKGSSGVRCRPAWGLGRPAAQPGSQGRGGPGRGEGGEGRASTTAASSRRERRSQPLSPGTTPRDREARRADRLQGDAWEGGARGYPLKAGHHMPQWFQASKTVALQ
jgi:hypothetical protein